MNHPRTIPILRSLPLLSLLPLLALLTGCSTINSSTSSNKSAQPILTAVCQYFEPVGQVPGWNTVEVYIENTGSAPAVFRSAELDGKPLSLDLRPAATRSVTVQLDKTMALPPLSLEAEPPADVGWWQFYPNTRCPAGQTVVFDICFRERPTMPRKLTLTDAEGNVLETIIPAFSRPARRVTAMTFSLLFDRLNVQVTPPGFVPEHIWLNHQLVKPVKILRSGEPMTADLFVIKPPFPIKAGVPVHVAMAAADGQRIDGYVRAVSGVTLDSLRKLWPWERSAMGLDSDPAVLWIPTDVTCKDVQHQNKGVSAQGVLAERRLLLRDSPNELSALAYCTAIFPELWNIYGHVADGVYAKPYRLGWGHKPERFIEEEEDEIKNARNSARPRPFFYIPEPFQRRGRHIEAQELEVVIWLALVEGAKGVRYHFWRGSGEAPVGEDATSMGYDVFPRCPALKPAITKLNASIRSHREELSALVPVSERTLDEAQTGGTPHGWVKVYTSWCGERGMLVMVRNLNYKAGMGDNKAGADPKFKVDSKTGLTIPVIVPQGFVCRGAKDFLSGAELKAERNGETVKVAIDRLDAYRLLWVQGE